MKPLVSIVIPVYNGSNYLAEAIDSALAQTYENIEIIVVNDGSKDDGATEKVALSYGDKIRYIAKENGGVSSALNRGIAEMKGEYFSWLSHDDIYLPEKIAKQVSLIENEKDIILCSGSLMDMNGVSIFHYTKTLDKKLKGCDLLNEHMHGYALNGLGFLVPRIAFEKAGMFDESMRYLQDLDMWFRMTWYGFRFVCHSDLLVVSRIHRGQQTNTISDLFHVDRANLAKKHAEDLKNIKTEDKVEILKNYLYFFARGNNTPGIEAIKQQLNELNEYNCTVYFNCFKYYLVGRIKTFARKVRDMVLKICKIRD